VRPAMSETGQKRRFRHVGGTSAFPPIATVVRTSQQVRFVPMLLKKDF
jgi:hypothetical protein